MRRDCNKAASRQPVRFPADIDSLWQSRRTRGLILLSLASFVLSVSPCQFRPARFQVVPPPSRLIALRQIGVSAKALGVELEQAGALGSIESLVSDRISDRHLNSFLQFLRAELNVAEHIGDGVALDDRVNPSLTVGVDAHMGRVGVAEQIVQVAERFLVSADEEQAQVIGLAFDELMERQRARPRSVSNKVLNLAIGIAGDIPQYSVARLETLA